MVSSSGQFPDMDALREPGCLTKFFANPYAFFMRSRAHSNGDHFQTALGAGGHMLDLIYIVVGLVLFVACWASTKGCDRL